MDAQIVVLGKNTGVWPILYEDVEEKLREKFGMELAQMRPKGQPGMDSRDDPAGDADAAPSNRRKKQPAGSSSGKAWVLRSILPSSLIASMNEPKTLATNPRDSGAILDWPKGDGAVGGGIPFKGILFTILGIILVRDRMIPETQLHKTLKDELSLSTDAYLPFCSPDSTAINQSITLDQFLQALYKQSYLERTKVGPAVRGATALDAGRDSTSWEIRWGARSDAEIGEKAVMEFMLDIAADDQPSSDEEDTRGASTRNHRRGPPSARDQEEKRVRKRKRLKADIEKAAGGKLQSLVS